MKRADSKLLQVGKHKDKIIKCRAIQRTQRQRNSDADNEEDAEDEDEHSSGRSQPQDNTGDEATGGGTIDDQGESNSSSLTTNTTTTEEGRGDVPDTAAPRTISWKSNQNDEDEVQESYNTSLLRRAKKEAPKHLLALHDMVNGDKDLALAILALAKREIEGEKRISKQGLIDVDKAIVLAIKNTIKEFKPLNGSGSYRKENQELIYGILAAISNGLPSVTGKDGICKALAKITDCGIRKRLSISHWMAASSQKLMSNLETIREYKHPVREVRSDSVRDGLAKEAVQKWQHGDNSPTSFTNRDNSRNTAKDDEKCPPRVWEGIVAYTDKFQAFIDSDEYAEFFEAHKLTIGFTIFCESLCKCTEVPTMKRKRKFFTLE